MKQEIVESGDKTRRATIYEDGFTVRRIFTHTLLGDNSAGFEVQYPNIETARIESRKWIEENRKERTV